MGSSRSLLEVRCCSEASEDFLSGTFGFLFTPVGDKGLGFGKKVDGIEDVGVSDWLEYPLEGDARPISFSGEGSLKSLSTDGSEGVVALEPDWEVCDSELSCGFMHSITVVPVAVLEFDNDR